MTTRQLAILAAIAGFGFLAVCAFGGYFAYASLSLLPSAPVRAATATTSPKPIIPSTTPVPSVTVFVTPTNTRTPVPPPTRRATWTPGPTASMMPTMSYKSLNATQASYQIKVLCSSPDVQYNIRVHAINLEYLRRHYQIWIDYYEDLKKQDLAQNDAFGIYKDQQSIDNLKKEYAADVASENKIYKLSVPAACR